MEIKKTLLIIAVVLSAGSIHAQTEKFDRTGIIRAQANISGGYLFQQREFGAYVSGDIDVYVAPKVSVTGEGWYGINIHTGEKGIQGNHALFSGINYHFIRHKHWDPYIGFSPGAGFVVMGYDDSLSTLRQSRVMAAPLVSVTAGCNWYVGTVFHFFVKLRFVSGQVMGDPPTPTRLEELKLSAGLGWNIRAWNRKKGQKWWEQ